MDARLGDHCAAPGVADEDRRAVLSIEDPRGRGDVIFERGERVLDDGDREAPRRQVVVHATPAGTISEGAMHQHNVLDLLIGGAHFCSFLPLVRCLRSEHSSVGRADTSNILHVAFSNKDVGLPIPRMPRVRMPPLRLVLT